MKREDELRDLEPAREPVEQFTQTEKVDENLEQSLID